MNGHRLRQKAGQLAMSALCLAIAVVWSVPFGWMISTAFKPSAEIFRLPLHWIPEQPTLENFTKTLSAAPFGTYYLNSALVATTTTLLVLLIASMAGLTLSGVLMWRAWWNLPVEIVRASVVLHAVSAFALFGLIILHIYAAIWTRGTLRAMVYGTVNRAWAKYHHPIWYRRMTGEKD